MRSRKVEGRTSKDPTKARCGTCGQQVIVLRCTALYYGKIGRPHLCNECRKIQAAARNRERTEGICDGCGATYDVHKLSYTFKKRNHKKCLCPGCAKTVTGKAIAAANLIRFAQRRTEEASKDDSKNRFLAPCGHIIRNTIRNRRHTGPCWVCNISGWESYEKCLDEASNRGWDGWSFVKVPKEMEGLM